jgi:hypothetical protein
MWVLANKGQCYHSIVNSSPVTAANPNGVGSSNYLSARDKSNSNDCIFAISALKV